MNTGTPLDEGIRVLAEETGIAEEQLWKMRPSELQPLFTLVDIKIRLRIETSQKERDRLLAEQEQWLNMHPLWQAHLEGIGQKPNEHD